MASIAIDRRDGLSSSTAIKGPVRVATTANITLIGLQTIDDVVLASGDRVLVKDQDTTSENGIWIADTGTWRRAKDFSRNDDVRTGTQIYVTAGTLYEASGWYVSTANPLVIGTTSIEFTQNVLLNAAQLEALEEAAGESADAAAADAADALAAKVAAEAAAAGVGTLYADRATAAAANVPAPVMRVWVAAPSGRTLSYIRDASGTALTTADGAKWSPDGDAYPDHWAENTTPGTTDMTAAIQAACDHGDYTNVRLLAATYAVNGTCARITSNVDSGANFPFFFKGAGRQATKIVQGDNDAHTIHIDKGFGNDLGWMHGTLGGFTIEYNGTTSANIGRALNLEALLACTIEDITIDGPAYHIYLTNVAQCWFDHIYLRNNLVATGETTKSVWTLTSNNRGRCFANRFISPEFQAGKKAEIGWDLQALDTMEVIGGHTNNCVKSIHIRPDNSEFQRYVAQVFFTSHYFDELPDREDVIYIEALNPGATTPLTRIEGLYFNGCYFRGGTGSVVKLGPAIASVAGLLSLKELHFIGCDAQDFDGVYFQLVNENLADPTETIKNISWLGGTIEDGPNTPKTDNLAAFIVTGKNIRIATTFSGGWTDSGGFVVVVKEQSENVEVTGNIFDVARAVPVLIDPSSVNCRAWGNTRSGDAGGVYVVEVVDEGTNANGYYRQYADGRLICTRTITAATQDANTALGTALFRGPLVNPGAFPKNFSAVPIVTGAAHISDTVSAAWLGTAGLPTATDWGDFYIVAASSTTGRTHTVMLRAEGIAA